MSCWIYPQIYPQIHPLLRCFYPIESKPPSPFTWTDVTAPQLVSQQLVLILSSPLSVKQPKCRAGNALPLCRTRMNYKHLLMDFTAHHDPTPACLLSLISHHTPSHPSRLQMHWTSFIPFIPVAFAHTVPSSGNILPTSHPTTSESRLRSQGKHHCFLCGQDRPPKNVFSSNVLCFLSNIFQT